VPTCLFVYALQVAFVAHVRSHVFHFLSPVKADPVIREPIISSA
jgi:hypothetical protein